MAIQQVGVEAVVKGLAAFQGDMRKINQSLQGLRGEGTFLQRTFASLSEGILNFGAHIVDIAKVALGVLLRDAIRAVVDGVKELVNATIEAGSEFQTLELRLERLNYNQLVESGKQYTDMTGKAIDMTRQQIDWLIKLAGTTPYDATDVANVFTLARSYGFSADKAQDLTESILDFASGMALGNQEIERIIVNFGQMVQQGKLNGQELRDLARGAFVPVNEIQTRMIELMNESGTVTEDFTGKIADERKKLRGLQEDLEVALQKQEEWTDNTKESTKMAQQFRIDELRRKIGESEDLISNWQERTGKAVELTQESFQKLKEQGKLGGEAVGFFIQAFEEMVGEKFSGASEKMAQTFKASVENMRDIAKGVFGDYTVKPILDVLGKRTASFADVFTSDEIWGQFVKGAARLGDALADVVAGVLDLLPGVGTMADQIIELINRAAAWVEENRENIIGFFRGMGQTIREDIVPWIQEHLIPAVQAFFAWINENKEEILQFFADLGTTIIEDVVPFVRDYLIPAFKNISEWVLENKELILSLFNQLGDVVLQLAEFFLPKLEAALQWIEENPDKTQKMIDTWTKWQFVGTILSTVGGIIISVAGFLSALTSILQILGTVLSALVTLISGPVAMVLAAAAVWIAGIRFMINLVIMSFNLWRETIRSFVIEYMNVIASIKTAFEEGDWAEIGMAIINGIISGFTWGASTLVDAAQNVVQRTINAAKSALGIGSPSKVFFDIGAESMKGMAIGIQKSMGMAALSAQTAMSQVARSAVPGMTNSTTINNTSNYNLTVNSSAPTEPIVQDFNMMQSLAGV